MKFRSKNEKILYWIYRMSRKEWAGYGTENNATTKTQLSQDLCQWHHIPESRRSELSDASFELAHNTDNILRGFDMLGVLQCDLFADLENVFLYDLTPVQAVNRYRKKLAQGGF